MIANPRGRDAKSAKSTKSTRRPTHKSNRKYVDFLKSGIKSEWGLILVPKAIHPMRLAIPQSRD